jgi:SAM-dependent methyltransferase
MIKTFKYKGREYPEYEKEGFASRFAFPFALEVCQGKGLDIGYSKEEWKLPGSIGIEKGDRLPWEEYDYIFSSHCLEHIPDWVGTLDYWITRLKIGGVLFLYLPHYDQVYWRPWNNTKHLHIFNPQILIDFLTGRGFIHIFNSERDLYDSFMIFGERREKLAV